MGNVWFTSDQHFQHPKVAELRGFPGDVDAHDRAMIDVFYDQIKAGDDVWMLGDLSGKYSHVALQTVRGMGTFTKARFHLISGNHDVTHPINRQSHKFVREFLQYFDSVQTYARRRVEGHEVFLSHFPYESDHTERARYTQHRLRNEGAWLLHGHTHSDQVKTSSREIHVGWDAWKRLVSLEEIGSIIKDQLRSEIAATQEAEHPPAVGQAPDSVQERLDDSRVGDPVGA